MDLKVYTHVGRIKIFQIPHFPMIGGAPGEARKVVHTVGLSSPSAQEYIYI